MKFFDNLEQIITLWHEELFPSSLNFCENKNRQKYVISFVKIFLSMKFVEKQIETTGSSFQCDEKIFSFVAV